MSDKYEPAFVADGRSVTTLRGIAHAGAKLSWRDLDGKNEQAKKVLFTKLLNDGFLEPAVTQADKFNESMSGQIGFSDGIGEDSPGEAPPGEVPPGEVPPGEVPPGEALPSEKTPKTGRKSGAKRK